MSKYRLVRLIVPAALIVAALLIWSLWGNGGGEEKHVSGGGMTVALIVLALLFSAQPLLEDMFEIPIVWWIAGILFAMIVIGFFFSNTAGFLGIALVVVAGLLFSLS